MAAVFGLLPFGGKGVGGPAEDSDALEEDAGVADTLEGASTVPRINPGPSSG
jgi:hypothetical protein